MTSHRAAVLAAVDALENAWRLVKPGWHIRDRFAALREVANRIPDPERGLPYRAQPIAMGEEPRVPRARSVTPVKLTAVPLTLPCPQCGAVADRGDVERWSRCNECHLASKPEPVPSSTVASNPPDAPHGFEGGTGVVPEGG